MKVVIKDYWPGVNLHYCFGDTLWASKGYQVLKSHDGGRTWDTVARIPAAHISALCASIESLRRLLRLGIRSYLQVHGESFLVFSEGRIFYWREGLPAPTLLGRVRYGIGPTVQGCCHDTSGTCYYGEYWGNKAREEVHIYRWQPGQDSWQLFHRFPAGSIRHIHAVQFDPFSGKVWVATGDRDPECIIGYFEGSPDSPQLLTVASGSQMARAVSLIFTSEHVYWGSDAGKDTAINANLMYRWSRKNRQIERLAPVGAPVYYSTTDDQGRLFVSTVVEGSPSESDSFARVWMSEDGTNWQEIVRWEKDPYPMLFGYGVLSFPQGVASNGRLYVVGQGVKGAPGTWLLEV